MNLKPCYFCGRAGQLHCGGCGKVSACCSAHLNLHRRGKEPCFPWEILEKPLVGRCMVTSRKVCAGETLFQEEPVVIGPNQVGSPICLSCYSSIDLQYRCTSCQYPLCGPDCQTSSVHAEECAVLSRGEPPVFQEENTEAYHCILPLRLVLLSRSNPDIFNLTDRLMDHEEERSQGEDWQITERTVVKNILEICKGEEIEKFTIQEVRRAVGVLEVNSYEVHSFVRCGYRGCFPAASLLSHGCVANSRHIWSTTPPYTNTCIATVDLEKGEEIITSYHLPTTCSILRRPKLLAGWYFECNCKRCESADELGTHLNTQICKGCGSPSLLPTTPLQIGSDWVCQNSECLYRESEKDALKTATDLVDHIKTISKSDRYNIQLWLDILDKAESQVHPQHEAVIEICKWLLPIFCRGPNTRTQDYALDLLRRKIELAKRQTRVLNVIEPGISKVFMYED
ncbi:protein msta isoform X2 [Eurytemora carolleeae]|uniref:protein msta isoform X2 n=1 Tax=Eurytemora carolleeae TaxID=1294199 RepID=UPI000C75E650|nr:protein msta isoform X2 [Eurytemora carolleeae]|eukprot:XP_023349162.1 protein msta-like isoform X2 [Eurytemora affinis]